MKKKIYELFLKCRSVTTDSRRIKAGDLFFALRGDNFNGNTFALQAIDSGAVCAIVDDSSLPSHDQLLQVEDVLATLHELAAHHRKQMKAKVLAITGSNGKTTTKELISAVLARKYKVISTKGNLNNHIGVPLTLLTIDENTEFAVVEMGANHQGEIRKLASIASPDYGLITNIGKAHLEGFGGFTGVINAKSELYAYIDDHGGQVFVHADDPLLMTLTAHIQRFTYGSGLDCSVYAELVSVDPFVHLAWEFKNMQSVLKTRIIGEYNAPNIMAAVAVGCWFGLDKLQINEALAAYLPSNSRSQLIESGKNRIIMDAYNANPVSMEAAIRNFDKFRTGSHWLILGDMLELGHESEVEHALILKLITDLDFKNVILVGPHFGSVYAGDDWLHFEKTSELLDYLKTHSISACDILLKASRGIGLEKVLPLLT